MRCNTLDGGLICPHCKNQIVSGVGFRLGKIANLRYKLGDELAWDDDERNCRPAKRPRVKTLKTIGYFNCDRIQCASWNDCYPDVQLAVITVEENVLTGVEPYSGPDIEEKYAIVEPKSLRKK